jgi:hypothetical protein
MNPVIVANLWIGAEHLDEEIAVLNGYEVFPPVEKNGAGVIICDCSARTVEYSQPGENA